MRMQELEYVRNSLRQLIGRSLSSVEFVRDYVQLRFDGPTMTVLTPIEVSVGGRVVKATDQGFKDALCGRISSDVVDTMVEPEACLELRFEDHTVIRVSIDPADYVAPEAVLFGAGGVVWWVC